MRLLLKAACVAAAAFFSVYTNAAESPKKAKDTIIRSVYEVDNFTVQIVRDTSVLNEDGTPKVLEVIVTKIVRGADQQPLSYEIRTFQPESAQYLADASTETLSQLFLDSEAPAEYKLVKREVGIYNYDAGTLLVTDYDGNGNQIGQNITDIAGGPGGPAPAPPAAVVPTGGYIPSTGEFSPDGV